MNLKPERHIFINGESIKIDGNKFQYNFGYPVNINIASPESIININDIELIMIDIDNEYKYIHLIKDDDIISTIDISNVILNAVFIDNYYMIIMWPIPIEIFKEEYPFIQLINNENPNIGSTILLYLNPDNAPIILGDIRPIDYINKKYEFFKENIKHNLQTDTGINKNDIIILDDNILESHSSPIPYIVNNINQNTLSLSSLKNNDKFEIDASNMVTKYAGFIPGESIILFNNDLFYINNGTRIKSKLSGIIKESFISLTKILPPTGMIGSKEEFDLARIITSNLIKELHIKKYIYIAMIFKNTVLLINTKQFFED